MQKICRRTAVILTMALLIGSLLIFPGAASEQYDGVQVSLTPDKESYDRDESIQLTVSVVNTNQWELTGVSVSCSVPEGYSAGEGSTVSVLERKLSQGETLQMELTLIPEEHADDREIGSGTNFENSGHRKNEKEGFSGWILIGVGIGLAAAAAILLLVMRLKKGRKVMSLLLCALLLGSLIAVPARAESHTVEISVSKDIAVGKESITVTAQVSFRLQNRLLTVTGGSGSGSYAPGQMVAIEADEPAPGYSFSHWALEGVTVEDAAQSALSFSMPDADVTAEAVYAITQYKVVVEGGTGSDSYAPGVTVTVQANEPEAGYRFAGWEAQGVTLADLSSARVEFVMPEGEVYLKALWEEKTDEAWVLPCNYAAVLRVYGPSVHPVSGATEIHNGIDLGAPEGTPVYAARSGTVIAATYNSSAGYYVLIDHGDGFRSVYMHMSAYVVSPGQTVTAGQIIGYVGSTGMSTGPHLHFGIMLNGAYVNPAMYIPFY